MDADANWIVGLKVALQQSSAKVLQRGDELFEETTQLFNQAVVSPAVAIVRVLTASDVSAVVLFAKVHGLSISVKGGGFNTAGWAVQGAIIVDLCEMDAIGIAVPEEATGIINVQPFDSNSTKAFCPASDPAKKRREKEAFGVEAGDAEDGRHLNKVWSGAAVGVDVLRDQVATALVDTKGGPRSPLTLDNLPLPLRTNHTSIDPQASASRPNSRASSSLDSGVHTRVPSSASMHEATSTGGCWSLGTENYKGKGRAADQEMDTSDAALLPTPLGSDGTRSWVADQTQARSGLEERRRPSLGPELNFSHHPSYATSFSTRRLSAPDIPLAFSSFGASAGLPGGINSNGFSFNPSAMAAPSSTGFVFNTAALASKSSLARGVTTTTLPISPPTISIPTASPSSSHVPSSLSPTAGLSPTSASSSLPSSTSAPLGVAALVTIEAGAKSRAIDAATAPYSFHVPLAAYPVGCAIFASGGFGFLSRLHGLSMDNVTEAEIVLMDGRIIHLSSEDERVAQADDTEDIKEKRDLWWAFRGAGITIGIVTRIRVKAYKVGLVYSGNLIYPFNPATTPSLIQHWRDCCTNAPRELYMNLILTAGPNPASHVVVIQLCYLGARSVGDQFLQNIMSWEGERCLLKDVETRTFLTQQDSVSQVLSAQAGNRWCIRANLMNSLPDECILATVAAFKDIPERSAWLFEIAAGAIADLDPSSSCFPLSHRTAPFQVAALHQWKSSDQDDRWTTTARNWINDVISPYSPGGSYPCFLESKEGWEKVRDTFGLENWERLVGMKKRWDSDNQLMNNFWPDDIVHQS